MSQRFSLYELLTVDQNIQFFGGVYGLTGAKLAERRRFAIEMAGLAGREDTLARDLAGGWRQRLALGCAILHEPAILFLDEPTGGVDPLSRRQFWRLIDTLSQRRRHGARDDALSRRGRALSSRGADPCRTARGHRHHQRGEAGVRRPSDSRDPCRQAGGRDAAARRDAAGREDQPVRDRGARRPADASTSPEEIARAPVRRRPASWRASTASRRRSRTSSST